VVVAHDGPYRLFEPGVAASHVSVAAMLTLTNDGFVAARDVVLPLEVEQSVTRDLEARDIGSEANSESCDHVPLRGARAPDDRGAEGRVLAHPGIRGDVDIAPRRGWTGRTLGSVTVVRVR